MKQFSSRRSWSACQVLRRVSLRLRTEGSLFVHVVGYEFKVTMCPSSASSFQPFGQPGDEAPRASRDLVPCPLPFPECTLQDAAALKGKSRSVRSRIRHSASLREWANEGVTTINELADDVLSTVKRLATDAAMDNMTERSTRDATLMASLR